MEKTNEAKKTSAIEEVKEALKKMGLTEAEIQDVLHDLQLEDDVSVLSK